MSVIDAALIRSYQSSELRDHAKTFYPVGTNILYAGDFNAPIGDIDPVVYGFIKTGHTDTH